ncbi:hypothetical protein Tco_0335833 [Tanacetum coccineum]
MLTGKWTRMHGDCQRFNAYYKQANRKSGENEADLIKTVKTVYLERVGKKIQYPHVWKILKEYPKWDAAEPIDGDNLQEVFGSDKRERPADKQRAGKKQKSVERSGSTGGSQSESVSLLISQDCRRKCDAAERAYEAHREKDLAIKKCEEIKFLMIDTSNLPPHKRAFIERSIHGIALRFAVHAFCVKEESHSHRASQKRIRSEEMEPMDYTRAPGKEGDHDVTIEVHVMCRGGNGRKHEDLKLKQRNNSTADGQTIATGSGDGNGNGMDHRYLESSDGCQNQHGLMDTSHSGDAQSCPSGSPPCRLRYGCLNRERFVAVAVLQGHLGLQIGMILAFVEGDAAKMFNLPNQPNIELHVSEFHI